MYFEQKIRNILIIGVKVQKFNNSQSKHVKFFDKLFNSIQNKLSVDCNRQVP